MGVEGLCGFDFAMRLVDDDDMQAAEMAILIFLNLHVVGVDCDLRRASRIIAGGLRLDHGKAFISFRLLFLVGSRLVRIEAQILKVRADLPDIFIILEKSLGFRVWSLVFWNLAVVVWILRH